MPKKTTCEKMPKKTPYEKWVESNRPKTIEDDSFTPTGIYDEVKAWACERYDIDPEKIVRPFWPGKDYETFDYPDGCVVLDNPPFSILAQIIDYYQARGILFFLFAPYLTVLDTTKNRGVCAVVCDADINYEGAIVSTAFATNLEKEIAAMTAPDLRARIEAVEKRRAAEEKTLQTLPTYRFPREVLTATMLGRMARYGIAYSVRHDQAHFITALDSQRAEKKGILGGGLLLSEKATVEKVAAEKAAAEKRDAIQWLLSPEEKEIIKSLK